ncbi:MAG: DnaJ domain-containing protein [Planctomycetota bacterium]
MTQAAGQTGLSAATLPPCPQCGQQPLSSLACLACGAVLEEPADATHYQRLGLPAEVVLDAAALERNYLRLSRALHPDFHGAADEPLRERVNRHSAHLNEAHGILADEQERAEYLLTLRDPQALERWKALAPAFLAEAMEVSEEVEQARGPEQLAARQALAQRAQSELARRRAALREPAVWNPLDARQVATWLHEARVWLRILRDIEGRRGTSGRSEAGHS